MLRPLTERLNTIRKDEWRDGCTVVGSAMTARTSSVAIFRIVIQIGVPPVRIDLLTSVSGLTFEPAWKGRIEVEIDGLTVPVIGRRALIENKRAAGRPQDLADIHELEQEQRDE